MTEWRYNRRRRWGTSIFAVLWGWLHFPDAWPTGTMWLTLLGKSVLSSVPILILWYLHRLRVVVTEEGVLQKVPFQQPTLIRWESVTAVKVYPKDGVAIEADGKMKMYLPGYTFDHQDQLVQRLKERIAAEKFRLLPPPMGELFLQYFRAPTWRLIFWQGLSLIVLLYCLWLWQLFTVAGLGILLGLMSGSTNVYAWFKATRTGVPYIFAGIFHSIVVMIPVVIVMITQPLRAGSEFAALTTMFPTFILTQSVINFIAREKIRQEFEQRYGPIDERVV